MDKLRDMIQQILQQFANKDDVMKRFAQLSKKIREIMDLLARQGGPGEDDAMFSKKPYGPVACASCEKNLVNLQGLPVDYHVWKKLPFRDPAERIARYGQGFSKILSHMRPVDPFEGTGSQGNSPTRNVGRHMGGGSLDDTHLQMSTPDKGYATADGGAGGFYRAGRTQGGDRKTSSIGGGYGTATTNPQTSVDGGPDGMVNHADVP